MTIIWKRIRESRAFRSALRFGEPLLWVIPTLIIFSLLVFGGYLFLIEPGIAPAPSTPLYSDYSTYIDNALKNFVLRDDPQIRISCERNMQLNCRSIVKLALRYSPSSILRQLQKVMPRDRDVVVTDILEAHLHGSAFSITPFISRPQAITQDTVGEWAWEVRPHDYGEQNLYLTITVHFISAGGTDYARQVQMKTLRIAVAATTIEKILAFLDTNLWALMTAIVIPLCIAGYRRYRRQQEQNIGLDNEHQETKIVIP